MSHAPLAGALDTLALADVLQLLELGRKRGVLAVDAGDGERRGLVRLRDGGVAAARFRDAGGRELRDPVDAVAAMLTLGSGRFTFLPDPTGAPEPTAAEDGPPVAIRVEALLLEATRRLDEAASVDMPPAAPGVASRPADPRLDAVPVLVADEDAEGDAPLDLRAADWALLAAVDGRRTVGEVAAAAGQGAAVARAALDRMAAAGLIRYAAGGDAASVAGAVAPAPVRSSTW